MPVSLHPGSDMGGKAGAYGGYNSSAAPVPAPAPAMVQQAPPWRSVEATRTPPPPAKGWNKGEGGHLFPNGGGFLFGNAGKGGNLGKIWVVGWGLSFCELLC